jgi:BirA family transcriptional regulator, biotin operon repressor / biotin---[acetyl-CoA-carboxylase] ligase
VASGDPVIEADRPAPLPPELEAPIGRVLATAPGALGERLLYYPVAGSTNDLAARLADLGFADGTVVLADQQTAGRGRGGNTWYSPSGAGLYLSVIVRTDAAQRDAGRETANDWPRWLTLAAGVAVAEGLHTASGLPVSIKWPNDLVMAPAGMVPGARKLGGILAEARADAGRLSHVVVGVGINVRRAAYPPEISVRATSLEDELGREIERGPVLAALLQRLTTWLDRLRAGQTGAVVSRWSALAVGASGAAVEWSTESGPRRGVTGGVDPDGALLVRTGPATERVLAGEVTWL